MEKIDVRKAVKNDITAAVSLLRLMLENEDIYEMICQMLDELQEQAIKKEQALNEVE